MLRTNSLTQLCHIDQGKHILDVGCGVGKAACARARRNGCQVVGIDLSPRMVEWATGSNAFFSLTVRIQKERSHAVATGGPYRFVRHPSYAGGILFELAAPIMLGSWWALIPGGLNAILFVIRTALEDKTLQAELDGYQEYAQRTRYRVLPGIW